MKRGTAAKVILGKDTLMDVPAGIVHGTDVILGGKAGLLNDFGGLVLSNNLMLGKKVSRGTITTVTVRGQSPLVLPDAIAGSLQAVKAFGGTEQNGTPAPDAPVDIVSNNGALKVRHQSGLPWGYTLLDFVNNASGTRIDTGIYDDIDDFSIEIRVTPSSGSWYICQSRANSNAQIYGLSGASSGAKISMGVGFSAGSVTSDISRVTTHIYTIIGSHKNGVSTLYVKDETTEDEDTQTTTYDTNDFTAAPTTIGVWGQSSNTVNAGNDIYYLKIRKGGVLVADYIPCQYNGENGFYDLVTQSFFGATAGTINAGNPVSDPVVAYADGTVETIKLLYNHWDMTEASHTTPGFNVSSVSVAQDGTFSVTNSSGSSGSRIQLTLSASVLGLINGQKYTLKVFILDGNAFDRSCLIYHGSSYQTYSCDGTQTTLVDSWTQSADNDVKVGMLYFNDYAVGTTVRLRVMVVAGETEPDTYQPYIENTATAETLLKVGNYQDQQEILSGAVTRNVGVKVLNGTEDGWGKTNNSFTNTVLFADKKIEKSTLFCSHFQYSTGTTTTIQNGCIGTASGTANVYFRNNALSTVEDWEQWLADQYAAGTPVIVVYPLDEPITESVAGQTLQLTTGDNVLEITQAGLDGLELEATYKSLVQLTIQEVEDANLNNNVEVTIS